MGRAHKAPAPNYTRARTITVHALERMRERGDRDMIAMTDVQLGNLLDAVVSEAVDAGHREDIVDSGQASVLVDISHALGLDLRAVVRNGAVVTVLTPEQAANNAGNGKWKRPGGESMALAKLGDKMPKNLPVAPYRENAAPPAAAVEQWLVRYQSAGPFQQLCHHQVAQTKVRALVDELLRKGVAPDSIFVYRPVATSTRVVVEIGE